MASDAGRKEGEEHKRGVAEEVVMPCLPLTRSECVLGVGSGVLHSEAGVSGECLAGEEREEIGF